MATRVDSSKTGKAPFKKRAIRPWQSLQVIHNPNAEDNSIDTTLTTTIPIISAFGAPVEKPSSNEIESVFQYTSEPIEQKIHLEIAQKEKEVRTLNEKLSTNESTRLTFGGFFQPKNIVFSDENAALHNTAHLLNELKEKEHEILELSQTLKLAQLKEKAERAEGALHTEVQARQTAEERAIYALDKAQMAADQCLLAEQQLALTKQKNEQLKHTVTTLEQELQVTLRERHQTIEGLAGEIEAKKHLEEHLKRFEIEIMRQRQIESTNQDLTQTLEHFKQAHAEALSTIENLKIQIIRIQEQLDTKAEDSSQYTLKLSQLTEKLNFTLAEKTLLEEKWVKSQDQIQKMHKLIHTERQLRKMYEERAREIGAQVFNLQIQLKAEEQAKRAAEDKVKQTMAQASKVMMNLFQTHP